MTLSGAPTQSQSGPGSNGNEGVLNISQSLKAGDSLSDCLISFPGHSLGGGITLCRDAVFYCPRRMGFVVSNAQIY